MKSGMMSVFALLVVCSFFVPCAQAQHPGWLDTKFKSDPGANANVYAVGHASDGKIYMAGLFTSVDGVSRTYLVRLLSDGSLDTTFNCTINDFVYDLVVLSDDTVIISGDFTHAGGVSANGIAKLQANGQYDPFFAIGSGVQGSIKDMALTPDGNDIIVVGDFTGVAGVAKPYIAKIDMLGFVDTAFPVDTPNNYMWAVSVDESGKIYMSGYFTMVGFYSRDYLARLNVDGSVDSVFYPFGLNFGPSVITPNPNGGVFIGGIFTQIEGTNVNRLARLSYTGQLDRNFLLGSGANEEVRDIVIQNDGKLIIGGEFTMYNGTYHPYCARLESSGAIDTNFNYFAGFVGGRVEDLDLLPSEAVLMVGQMTNFGYMAVGRYCRLMPDYSVMNDFDGDGYTDIVVYYSMPGDWYIRSSVNGELLGGAPVNWGWGGAIPATADYDTDGKTDLCVFDTSNGNWYIRPSTSGQMLTTNFGWAGTVPVVGDYNGDRFNDLAVYDRNTGNWYIQYSSSSAEVINWGWPGAMPVPADYDGDGITDIAIYHPATGNWYIRNSSSGWVDIRNFGWADAQPVPYDYDRDGKADIAVYHAAAGKWYISYYSGQTREILWGTSVSVPVCGLYNGSINNFTTYALGSGVWSIWPTPSSAQWGWADAWPVWLQFWINDMYGFWSKG